MEKASGVSDPTFLVRKLETTSVDAVVRRPPRLPRIVDCGWWMVDHHIPTSTSTPARRRWTEARRQPVGPVECPAMNLLDCR